MTSEDNPTTETSRFPLSRRRILSALGAVTGVAAIGGSHASAHHTDNQNTTAKSSSSPSSKSGTRTIVIDAPHDITLSYQFRASGGLRKLDYAPYGEVPDKRVTIDPEDDLDGDTDMPGDTVHGEVRGGHTDAYEFKGEIKGFLLDHHVCEQARIWIDGEKVKDPCSLIDPDGINEGKCDCYTFDSVLTVNPKEDKVKVIAKASKAIKIDGEVHTGKVTIKRRHCQGVRGAFKYAGTLEHLEVKTDAVVRIRQRESKNPNH